MQNMAPRIRSAPTPDSDDADLDNYLSSYAAAYEKEQSRTRQADALAAVVGACEWAVNSALDDAVTV